MHDGDLIEDDYDPDDPPDVRGAGPSFRTGGLHPMVWILILFALVDLAWNIVNANLPATANLADDLFYAIQVVPSVVAFLIPAAFLARHRDAPAGLPVLLLGTLLLALVQILFAVADPLHALFETLTPASDDVPFLVPLAALYGGLTLLLGAIALGLVARGLADSRRYFDRGASLSAPLVAVMSIFATVVGILAVTRLSLPDGPLPTSYLVYLVSTVVLGILRVIVWTYLLTTAIGGWRAGEEPRGGWMLATLAGAVVLVALVLVNLAGVLDIQDTTIVAAYGWLITILYAGGHLVLLAAFAIGLPALEEIDDDDEDEDDDAGENEVEYEDAYEKDETD